MVIELLKSIFNKNKMVDITKCTNTDCHLRSNCYRWTSMASEHYQSYMFFKLDEKGECEFQIQLEPEFEGEGDGEGW